MSILVKVIPEIALRNTAFLALILKLISRSRQEQAYCWNEGSDKSVVGYEASWAGIFPRSMK